MPPPAPASPPNGKFYELYEVDAAGAPYPAAAAAACLTKARFLLYKSMGLGICSISSRLNSESYKKKKRSGTHVYIRSGSKCPKGAMVLVQELKNLRPQLYSASEYCEKSFLHSDQKQMVLDNLEDYAVRAVVNAVDHLGTVTFKLTELFEQQVSEILTFELKVASLNQIMLLLKFGWVHSMMILLQLWRLCWCRFPQERLSINPQARTLFIL